MTKEEFEKRDLIQTAVVVGIAFLVFVFVMYVEDKRSAQPIERHWLDEGTVCYKQNERAINCQTVGGWE
jgi:hypothetical protein